MVPSKGGNTTVSNVRKPGSKLVLPKAGKLRILSVPQSPHLRTGHANGLYLLSLGLNEKMYMSSVWYIVKIY